jgi:hypothetical protein
MRSSSFARHFPTFDRFLMGLVSALNWFLLRIQSNARVIMAIGLVIAVLLGWREYLVHAQREAVAAIERAGGAVLAHLAGLTKLKRLRLSGKQVTNAGLAHLGAMRQMEHLSLRQTRITTLEPIRAMTQLKFLDLVGSPIDDAGLKPVTGFTKLELLWLGSTRVSDAGLVHLDGLPNLMFLDLDRTSVSDSGLGLLCNLPRLNRLNLYATKVTDAGLADKLGGTTCRDLVVSGPDVTPAKLDLLRAKFPGMKIMGADLKLPKAPSSAPR